MVNDNARNNAINLKTGETIYVGILEKLPIDFQWIFKTSHDDFLTLIANLRKQTDLLQEIYDEGEGGKFRGDINQILVQVKGLK